MKTLITFLVFLISTILNAKIYYVAPSGTNTNSGIVVFMPLKSLTYASSLAAPSDTVYVKAGIYNENVTFKNSGLLGKPISFIGYKNIPGDVSLINTEKVNPYSDFLETDMPLFDGQNRAKGTAFNLEDKQFINLKNFQIRNYEKGVICGGYKECGHLNMNNIEVMNCGNINSSYSGLGFSLGLMGTKFSNNNILTNCMVLNASAEGIGVYGDSNTLTNCKVYCNDNRTDYASTDYYIIICGSYNNINNCYVDRNPGLAAEGHGIGAKSNAEQVVDKAEKYPVINPQYNNFNNCEAHNMDESFYVRHRGVQFNTFTNCRAYGTHTGIANSTGGEGNCIVTRDGASNNTFTSCIAINCKAGFIFQDTVEDGDTGSNPTGHPGNNNLYINCLIYNCFMGVWFDAYSVQSDAGSNTIQNCTFYKTRYIHECARPCANMKYIGNIYYGCLPNLTGGYFSGNTYAKSGITPSNFMSCDFWNIQGGVSKNIILSDGSISDDPDFVDADHMDFHLKICNIKGASITVK